MITMPDPGRTVERSAVLFRKYGAKRRESYLAVAELALEVWGELRVTANVDLEWLDRVREIAWIRANSLPADDCPRAAAAAAESASNDTVPPPL